MRAAQVGDDAAAGVVRRRHHRDRLARDVDAEFQAACVDVGEMLLEEGGRLVRDVEIDAVQAAFFHFEVDGARHDVARRQFGARVVLGHEAGAVGQQQDAAFAAHRFGDQEGFGVRVVQAGRVELDEFHVGHPAAGAPGHRDAVAGGGVGVGGVEIDLAGAAGGQHGMPGGKGFDLAAGLVEHIGAVAARCPQARACRR